MKINRMKAFFDFKEYMTFQVYFSDKYENHDWGTVSYKMVPSFLRGEYKYMNFIFYIS